MSRKKPNLVTTQGFRTDTTDYFKHVGYREHLKHATPFIFYLMGCVEAVYYTRDLLKKAADDDIILQAWVGQWTSDVFAFKLKDLRDYIQKENIKIL